jgi:hypothetical protein
MRTAQCSFLEKFAIDCSEAAGDDRQQRVERVSSPALHPWGGRRPIPGELFHMFSKD